METKTEAVELEQIRTDLVAWRGQRKKGERIPAAIWQRVAAAVEQHGLPVVSQTLGLSMERLQRKLGGGPSKAPEFVEVAGSSLEGGLGCVVELEKSNGTRLRIRVREAAVIDWGKIKEAFLGV